MKKFVSLLAVCFLIISCAKPDRVIALNKVGVINNQTTVEELPSLFKNDSIVSRLSEGDLGNINTYVLDNDTHLVYQKGGKLLLSISPINPLDSVSKIKSVTVFNELYQTKSGISVNSSFNDVNINHNIEQLEASFNLVTVFVKDINTTFTMDKEALGIKAFTLGAVDKAQVPNDSKFTSMTVWFEE